MNGLVNELERKWPLVIISQQWGESVTPLTAGDASLGSQASPISIMWYSLKIENLA